MESIHETSQAMPEANRFKAAGEKGAARPLLRLNAPAARMEKA
jgi:hypothetical protein